MSGRNDDEPHPPRAPEWGGLAGGWSVLPPQQRPDAGFPARPDVAATDAEGVPLPQTGQPPDQWEQAEDLERAEHRSRLPAVHEAWLPQEHPLHRPRHGGRQLLALILALIFFVAPFSATVLGAEPDHFENRTLQQFPSVTAGWQFGPRLTGWAADHIAFRQQAVGAQNWISRSVFGEPPAYSDSSPRAAGPIAAPQRGPGSEDAGFSPVVEGRDGWLFLGKDMQHKCRPEQPLPETLRALAHLRRVVEASGRRFVLVIPPDKSTVEPQYLPQHYGGKQCAAAARQQFWDTVPQRTSATDLRTPLQQTEEQLQGPIYHPLDSHWNETGALVMARQLAERISPGVSQEWNIRSGKTVQGDADLPPLIGQTGTNTTTYYQLDASGGDADDVNTELPASFRQPTSTRVSGRRGVVGDSTVVMGDSFLTSPARYLSATFSQITYYNYAAAAQQPGATGSLLAQNRVVVLEMVERNISDGAAGLLREPVIEAIGEQLASRPLR